MVRLPFLSRPVALPVAARLVHKDIKPAPASRLVMARQMTAAPLLFGHTADQAVVESVENLPGAVGKVDHLTPRAALEAWLTSTRVRHTPCQAPAGAGAPFGGFSHRLFLEYVEKAV